MGCRLGTRTGHKHTLIKGVNDRGAKVNNNKCRVSLGGSDYLQSWHILIWRTRIVNKNPWLKNLKSIWRKLFGAGTKLTICTELGTFLAWRFNLFLTGAVVKSLFWLEGRIECTLRFYFKYAIYAYLQNCKNVEIFDFVLQMWHVRFELFDLVIQSMQKYLNK